ncbi:CapA family protein [Candidatus Saccharibacteria bacterium]|nr:CapA family protein [Candidatus Saccharibacteria bacterium]
MNRKRHSFGIIITFIIVLAAVCGIMYFINLPRGKVIYDDSLGSEEKSLLAEILKDEKLKNDLTLSSETVTSIDGSELISGIEVPVVDFYYHGETKYIPFEELDSSVRITEQDGKNYLDDFKSGAKFKIIKIKSGNQEEQNTIAEKIKARLPNFPTDKSEVLSLNQTGVTALARGIQTKLNQVGDGAYFAENIKDLLSSSDLTHISNEVSFADDCKTDSSSTVLCADNRVFDTIKAIGTDIVELTGNHNVDVGKAAAIDTLKLYHDNNLKTFGGGENAEDAKKPLEINQKNTKITWLGFNLSTTKPGGGGATDTLPGANIYDEITAKKQIKEAKERGDFVIVDVQYYECYCYPDGFVEHETCDYPINAGESDWPEQEAFFKHLIDLGADMVVGTQAHQPQTFELYNDKPIYYGLGNLFFDQTYWPGTERSLILTHYFWNNKLLQTEITPTVYDESFQTTKMSEKDAKAFLSRLAKWAK